MADLTYEILTDRSKFPDDQEIVLASGDKITVKQFRDAMIPKADFTRQSETWARKERELSQTVDGLNQQLAAAIQARETAAAALTGQQKPPTPEGGYTEEQLLSDPILGPIMKKLNDAAQRLEEHGNKIKLHEDTWLKNQYLGKLDTLESKWNSEFNDDGKNPFDRKAFLDRALQTQTSDLDVLYDAYTVKPRVERAEKRGEERGVERGKKSVVPHVPFGRRAVLRRSKDLEGKTLQNLTDEEVEQDEEMQQALRGELPNEGRG